MSWDHQFGILLPQALMDLGNAIAKALDQWGDGSQTFNAQRVNSEGQVFTLSWAREAFIGFLATARHSAELLHSVVEDAYLDRFPGDDSPTLSECAAFLEAAEIYLDGELNPVRTLFQAISQGGDGDG